jgi:hypothetical protein
MWGGNVICGGIVGNGDVDHGSNVESHLCFRMCLSYSATVIRVCVRVLVSIILIAICILKIVVIIPVFGCK